ncbi:SpoIID/LytB domain-containing protein [Priestia abyssalis]|uniref:SpoIID/LytB domain-containing protein n=1 Tax=Priestia abyssalis TaxID=1221450 RepID=UPI0009951F04|nr:SpoIID/LytB domain-containing protein [Priestia abyssalis]
MKTLRKGMLLALVFVMILSLIPGIPAKAAEEPIIRVKLKNYLGNRSEIIVRPEVLYTTNLSNLKLEANQTYTLKVSNGNIIILKGSTEVGKASQVEVKPEKGKGPLSINGRRYLGSFTFAVEDQKYVRPINSIGLEDYLKGVVPAEMPPSWHEDALKAQTVAARTYAMGYINKIPDDTQYYQVYGGYTWDENATKAVEETEGQVITYGGKPIGSDALFSSSNGGKTESNANVWNSTARPYLPIKDDPYDLQIEWNLSIKKKQIDTSELDLTKADMWWASTMEAEQTTILANIKTWLQANGYANKEIKITTISDFSLHGKTSGGRVSKGSITIEFLIKEQGKALLERRELKDVSASTIRAMVGLDEKKRYFLMKSYLVDTVETTDETIEVSGKGFGHGVGLSQYGAKKAAESGKTYQEILAFYYEKTSLITAYHSTPEQPGPVEPAPVPTPEPEKDVTAPAIKDVKTSYDSKTNQATLNFATNENAKVTVYVKDQNGKVLSYLVNGAQKQAGIHSAVWKATSVNKEKYTWSITAVDSHNNKSSLSVLFTLTSPAPIEPKVMWGANELAKGQIGRIVFLKDVKLYKRDSSGPSFHRVAKKGSMWRVYDIKNINGISVYNLSGNVFVSRSNLSTYEKAPDEKIQALGVKVHDLSLPLLGQRESSSGVPLSYEVNYPQFSGLYNKTIENNMNTLFFNMANEARKEQIKLFEQKTEKPNYHDSGSMYYSVEYNRNNVLSTNVMFHKDNKVMYSTVNFNLMTGKRIYLKDVLTRKEQVEKVTQYIKEKYVFANRFGQMNLSEYDFYFVDELTFNGNEQEHLSGIYIILKDPFTSECYPAYVPKHIYQ